MSVAIVRDARGVRRAACHALHTPPLRLTETVPPGLALLVVSLPIAAIAAPPLLLLLPVLWFIAWLLWWFMRGRQRAAEVMAAEGRCASCKYQLAGLPPQSDGCTICPECGGAWKVEGGAFSPAAGR